MKDLIQGIVTINNLLTGKSEEKRFLAESPEDGKLYVRTLVMLNPDCLIIASAKESQFLHIEGPYNMEKDLILVSEGKMSDIEYLLKWSGIANNPQEEKPKPKPKAGRKEKPTRATDSSKFCQMSA